MVKWTWTLIMMMKMSKAGRRWFGRRGAIFFGVFLIQHVYINILSLEFIFSITQMTKNEMTLVY